MQYWVIIDGKRQGPLTMEELKALNITPETLVWREGLIEWIHAGSLEEMSPLLYRQEESPPAAPVAEEPQAEPQAAYEQPQPEAGYDPYGQQPQAEQSQPQAGYDPYGQQPQAEQSQPQAGYGYGYGPQQGYAPYGAYGAQAQQPVAPCPNDYKTFAIILLVLSICCCLWGAFPFAIVALVFASQVKPSYMLGDMEKAQKASKRAKTWCLVALGAGLLMFLILELMGNSGSPTEVINTATTTIADKVHTL